MNQTILTMAKQINAKELKFARFTLLANDQKNEITVKRGVKYLRIRYNPGMDLYEVQKGKLRKFELIEDDWQNRIYDDQLKGIIQDYFNFRYVMDSIRIVGVNC